MQLTVSAKGDMPNDLQDANSRQHIDNATSGTVNSTVDPEVDSDYVKVAGETIGITNLSDTCLSQLATHITFVLKEVVEQAKKFTAHGRRKRLIADDIDAALAVKGIPPLFGFCSKDGLPFRFAGSLGRDLFVTDDREIDLSPIVNAPPAKVPIETSLKAHWLVIDGVQPAVPENPTPVVEEEASISHSGEIPTIGNAAGPSIFGQSGRTIRKTEQVQIKTITTHALSVEQQIFFKEITEAIMGNDDARRTEALHSLQTDAGLQALLPRFSLAIAEGVRCNIVQHNLAILIYLMRMIQSLAQNPALSLDRCLHELLPSVMSCILSKQLCARPDTDNHWALREFSSRLLATICKTYNLNNLRCRVTQVLTKVWQDEQATLATMYGSVYALNELGVDTVRAVIIPRAAYLYKYIQKSVSDRSNAPERTAAEKLHNFVLKVLINHVRNQRPSGLRDSSDYRSAFGGFGEAIYSAISIEMPHPSSSTLISGTPKSSINQVGNGANSILRSVVDKRPPVPSPTQRFVTPVRPGVSGQRYVVHRQLSPTSHAGQQTFGSTPNSRLQTIGADSPKPTTSSPYYTSSANAGTSDGSFAVRQGPIKKMIVTANQRGNPGAGDGYRNM